MITKLKNLFESISKNNTSFNHTKPGIKIENDTFSMVAPITLK